VIFDYWTVVPMCITVPPWLRLRLTRPVKDQHHHAGE